MKIFVWWHRRRLNKLKMALAKKEAKLKYLQQFGNRGAPPGKRLLSDMQVHEEATLAGEVEALRQEVKHAYGQLGQQ